MNQMWSSSTVGWYWAGRKRQNNDPRGNMNESGKHHGNNSRKTDTEGSIASPQNQKVQQRLSEALEDGMQMELHFLQIQDFLCGYTNVLSTSWYQLHTGFAEHPWLIQRHVCDSYLNKAMDGGCKELRMREKKPKPFSSVPPRPCLIITIIKL